MTKERYIIYTDGGARGNPGPAAAGVVIWRRDGLELASFGQYLGETSNNDAEYQAVILALKKLKALIGSKRAKETEVELRTDSELAVRQLSGLYKIREERLQSFFVQIWNLKVDFGAVTFTHVPREENKEADRLVNKALDEIASRQHGS